MRGKYIIYYSYKYKYMHLVFINFWNLFFDKNLKLETKILIQNFPKFWFTFHESHHNHFVQKWHQISSHIRYTYYIIWHIIILFAIKISTIHYNFNLMNLNIKSFENYLVIKEKNISKIFFIYNFYIKRTCIIKIKLIIQQFYTKQNSAPHLMRSYSKKKM